MANSTTRQCICLAGIQWQCPPSFRGACPARLSRCTSLFNALHQHFVAHQQTPISLMHGYPRHRIPSLKLRTMNISVIITRFPGLTFCVPRAGPPAGNWDRGRFSVCPYISNT